MSNRLEVENQTEGKLSCKVCKNVRDLGKKPKREVCSCCDGIVKKAVCINSKKQWEPIVSRGCRGKLGNSPKQVDPNGYFILMKILIFYKNGILNIKKKIFLKRYDEIKT